MHKYGFILLVFVIGFNAWAQPPAKKHLEIHLPKKLSVDSTDMATRNIDKKVLGNFKKSTDFNYYVRNNKQTLSWWDRFWSWFWHLLNGKAPEKNRAPDSTLTRYIIIALAVILIGYLLLKLIGSDLTNIFSRKSKEINVPYSESLENIHEISFDEEIEKALAARNYKLAVRLLYLASLKHLNDLHLIHWQIEKTNSAYLNELKDGNQRQLFGILTRQFEYIWYGNFPVDGSSYRNISALFSDFKKILP
jgi:hypothetical protein